MADGLIGTTPFLLRGTLNPSCHVLKFVQQWKIMFSDHLTVCLAEIDVVQDVTLKIKHVALQISE